MGRLRMRRPALMSIGAAAVIICSVLMPAVDAAAAGGTWGNAEEAPGTAVLNAGNSAELNSVSCASAGNCSAGGYYADGVTGEQALVVSEVNGTWGTAEELPGVAALNVSGGAAVNSVSCASAGNCAAVGRYWDGSRHTQAFVDDEVNGTWGTAEQAPGTAALNAGGYAPLLSVSCASAGNCSAGGYYTDGANEEQPFVVSEVAGTWGTAQQVPGTAALNTKLIGVVVAVSCASAGTCTAVGNANGQVFTADEVNGAWGDAAQLPGIAALDTGGGAYATALSCASAGNCSAGGYWFDSVGNHAFVADEVNGTWGSAVQVPGTAALNAGENGQLDSVSCA